MDMNNKKVKWLIYTVLVALIPVLSRVIVWIVTRRGSIDLFNPGDFVAFGLVLHISNINEIEHIDATDDNWKTIQNGISIVFIAFYGVLFALTLLAGAQPSIVDLTTIKYCSMLLSMISFIVSYSVYNRISYISEAD